MIMIHDFRETKINIQKTMLYRLSALSYYVLYLIQRFTVKMSNCCFPSALRYGLMKDIFGRTLNSGSSSPVSVHKTKISRQREIIRWTLVLHFQHIRRYSLNLHYIYLILSYGNALEESS
jgi:hypothetical protein